MPVSPENHSPHANKTKHHNPIQRQSSAKRGYGYRWQKARAGYFSKHPLCAECERKWQITVATDLDHIIPHKGDMQLFWDRGNWQGLCKQCHSIKTAKEDGGFGNTRGVQNKQESCQR